MSHIPIRVLLTVCLLASPVVFARNKSSSSKNKTAQTSSIKTLISMYNQNSNSSDSNEENSATRRLRQELLAKYDKVVRPVKNHLTTTKVDMRLTIIELVDFDVANSFLTTDAWFHISWRDEFLVWDAKDYQNVSQLHFSPSEIWKPDIVLINSAQQFNLMSLFTDSEMVVNSTGEVLWITMGMLYSKCPLRSYNYPYVQYPIMCNITFCPLIYQAFEVNITTSAADFHPGAPVVQNPRLYFLAGTAKRFEATYDDFGSYSFLHLTLLLKRAGNALPLLIRVPTLVSISMVLCMFFMPVTWNVRINLSIFAILIQIILILYIGEQLGVNALGIARPIVYLRADLFLTCIALVSTLIARRLLAMADVLPEIPYLLSNFLAGPVARLLCFGINQSEYVTGPSTLTKNSSNSKPMSRTTVSSLLPSSLTPSSLRETSEHVTLVNEEDGSQANNTNSSVNDMWQTNTTIPQIVMLSNSQNEWMQLIVFCDRVLFVLYALIMLPRLI